MNTTLIEKPVVGGATSGSVKCDEFVVERGPNWLIVRVTQRRLSGAPRGDAGCLVERLWRVPERHLVYRVVLRLEGVESIDRAAATALRAVHDRLVAHGGALRLCGVRKGVARRLDRAAGRHKLQNHATPHDAVAGVVAAPVGAAPLKPR